MSGKRHPEGVEPRESAKPRVTVGDGCLLALLVPPTLVAVVFVGLGLFGFYRSFAGGPGKSGGDPGSALLILGFTLPILLVLGGALSAVIVRMRSGRRLPLVSWKLLVPASLLLGVPGLCFGLLSMIGVIDTESPFVGIGTGGAVFLIVAPFVLRAMQSK